MRLHFLGTTGYHPNDRRQTACLMLPEIGVVLDAGTGFYRARDLIATDSLSIFVSHAHLDHSIGLTYLFNVLYEKNIQCAAVYAAANKIASLKEHLFDAALFPAMPPIDFRPISTTKSVDLPQGGKLTAIELKHPGGSLGFRLDWPERSMAYITDTTAGPDEDYIRRIEGVDVLVHECYFADGEEERARITGHSCLTPVIQLAQRARVGRLALVHTNPLHVELKSLNISAARKAFPNLLIPEDGDTLDF